MANKRAFAAFHPGLKSVFAPSVASTLLVQENIPETGGRLCLLKPIADGGKEIEVLCLQTMALWENETVY